MGAKFPRTLVLSFTGIGSNNATGQLLDAFFSKWDRGKLFQVYWGHEPSNDIPSMDGIRVRRGKILDAVDEFDPEVIYLRPADTQFKYWRLTDKIVKRTGAPLVTHTMDDWPSRVKDKKMTNGLIDFLSAATTNMTICREMSDEYRERYGHEFVHFANGIDPEVWCRPKASHNAKYTIRYCGSLAEDMQRQSVTDIAQAVANLYNLGHPIALEIYTMQWCRPYATELTSLSPGITAHDLVPMADYPQLLIDADALVLAYNFDNQSTTYTRLSFANKTPECLVTGNPVLAYGPDCIPAIHHISTKNLGVSVTCRGVPKLQERLQWMLENRQECANIGERARKITIRDNNIVDIRNRFEQILTNAANQPI